MSSDLPAVINHDSKGRFLPGHSAARDARREKQTAWRGALRGAIGKGDIRRAVKALMKAVDGGDVAAIALLFRHTIGEPNTNIDLIVKRVEEMEKALIEDQR